MIQIYNRSGQCFGSFNTQKEVATFLNVSQPAVSKALRTHCLVADMIIGHDIIDFKTYCIEHEIPFFTPAYVIKSAIDDSILYASIGIANIARHLELSIIEAIHNFSEQIIKDSGYIKFDSEFLLEDYEILLNT